MLKDIYNKRSKPQGGFTIIEVLIVLAIAGLILLIVFLAIPALQRNAHNTSRKEDVSSLVAALNEYTDNNGGTTSGLTAGANPTFVSNANLGLYKAANVYWETGATTAPGLGTTSSGTVVTTSDVIFEQGFVCNTTTGTISTANATATSVAATYAIQSSNAIGTLQCVQAD
jgi:prepilin-type N-terminal cleavage/methylation domain-containing protein